MLGAKVVGGSCEHFVRGLVCKCFVSVWLLGMSSLVLEICAAPRFSMKRRTSETCRGTDVVAQSVVTLVSEQKEKEKKREREEKERKRRLFFRFLMCNDH